jgi:hypothetical protein
VRQLAKLAAAFFLYNLFARQLIGAGEGDTFGNERPLKRIDEPNRSSRSSPE